MLGAFNIQLGLIAMRRDQLLWANAKIRGHTCHRLHGNPPPSEPLHHFLRLDQHTGSAGRFTCPQNTKSKNHSTWCRVWLLDDLLRGEQMYLFVPHNLLKEMVWHFGKYGFLPVAWQPHHDHKTPESHCARGEIVPGCSLPVRVHLVVFTFCFVYWLNNGVLIDCFNSRHFDLSW